MRIAVTGANGAVGRAVVRHVTSGQGGAVGVVAAVRSERAAREVRPLLRAADRLALISYDDGASLRAALRDASAVIHLAGVLVEREDSSYETANVRTTRATAEAARASGVEKFVLVSAVGASETSANRYWRSKAAAEAVVRRSGLSHTILRVPLLLGRSTEGAMALRRRLRRRAVVLVGGGRTLQQPLHVDDVARAALLAARPGIAEGLTLDLVGPVALPEREIVERAARRLGREVRVRSIPRSLAWLAVAIRQRIAGPGFSPDALEVITTDTALDPGPATRALGLALTGVDDMIRQSVEPGP